MTLNADILTWTKNMSPFIMDLKYTDTSIQVSDIFETAARKTY